MTQNLPSLPTDPELKVLVVFSTMALVFFAISGFRKWRDRSPVERSWLLAPLLLALVAMVAGRVDPEIHRALSVLIMGVTLRNTYRARGSTRWLCGIGATLWIASLVVARMIFGG